MTSVGSQLNYEVQSFTLSSFMHIAYSHLTHVNKKFPINSYWSGGQKNGLVKIYTDHYEDFENKTENDLEQTGKMKVEPSKLAGLAPDSPDITGYSVRPWRNPSTHWYSSSSQCSHGPVTETKFQGYILCILIIPPPPLTPVRFFFSLWPKKMHF